jgi:hypothetical protein
MRLMVDLFSGLGGASKVFKQAGWEVITVDINPDFSPDLCMDVRDFLSVWDGRKPDFLWASPPCIEFSKSSMPWYGFKKPEWWAMELVFETLKIVHALEPKLWILENVRGAQKWIGKAPFHAGSFYLWGYFPFESLKRKLPRNSPSLSGKNKLFPSEDRAAKRAEIPELLSRAVLLTVEECLGQKKAITGGKELPLLQGVLE